MEKDVFDHDGKEGGKKRFDFVVYIGGRVL